MWINELGSWLGGAVIGVAVSILVDEALTRWRGQRGSMKGDWWQVIPVFEQEPEKLDRVVCRHNGVAISARISRTTPEDQVHRAWKFDGRVQGSLVYGVFFSDNPSDLSYGTIQLHKDNEAGTVWRGTYTRMHLASGESGWTETVHHIPLTWQRAPAGVPARFGSRWAVRRSG